MAQLPTLFDTRNAPPPREDFEILPAGEYVVVVEDSTMKDTKNGSGQYLELAFQVIDGAAKGRKLWTRLNLQNSNAQAVEIAQRELNGICEAVGHVGPLPDSVLLHNKPLQVRVAVIPAGTKRKNGTVSTADQNEIKAYKALAGTAPATASAPVATPAAGKAPWGKAA